MKFRIKQRLISLSDSFDIEDAEGRPVFAVKGKVFSLSSSQTMYDANGREILVIKRKHLSIMPTCRLINSDGSEWIVKKNFWPFWRTSFSITTPSGMLEMTGNIWQHEYEIRQGSKLLASISKKLFSWSDSYGVDVYEDSITHQILAAVIIIDRIQHSDRNSSFLAGGD